MRRLLHYLNPMAHLGERKYLVWFPLFFMIGLCIVSEIFAYGIVRNPMIVGVYGIFLFLALIIYFAFRGGIIGGLIASVITVLYYFYIIYTRHYSGETFKSGIDTTVTLGGIYLLLSLIIGWLKQTVDNLIEREANEKRQLQAIVQQLPVGVLIADKKGKLILGNKHIENILGRKLDGDISVGTTTIPNAQYRGKAVSPGQWPLAQTLATGRSIIGKEFTIDREDGKHIYLRVNSSLIHNKDGKTIAAASIINDITQEKELEERKDDFVNMASHELKTPITSMKLYIDSLMVGLKKFGDARSIKTLESIKGQTDRLQALVNDLLDVSRLQTGKLTFHKEQFRIDELVQETVDTLQHGAKQQKLVLISKSPVLITADKFRIYQVLTNLITNAIKYSPEDKEIRIKVKREAGKAVVSVQDFGIGIAKDHQKKIFERLYQVTDSHEKTFPGFGMGLYIAKEIVKRHKGSIWVESEKGKGSTFYFTLPTGK